MKPKIQMVDSFNEKPILIFAQDDSESIVAGSDSTFYKKNLFQKKCSPSSLWAKMNFWVQIARAPCSKAEHRGIKYDDEEEDFFVLAYSDNHRSLWKASDFDQI